MDKEKTLFYVTSSWKVKSPDGLIGKTVVICENTTQVHQIMDEMSLDSSIRGGSINFYTKKPYYSPKKYHVSTIAYDDLMDHSYKPWIKKD